MRNHLRATSLIVGAVLSAALPRVASAWEAPYIDQGVKAAVKAAEAEEKAKGQTGYGVRTNGVCLVGGFIDKGGAPLKWTFNLKDKKSYIMVAAGDTDVTGIEIKGYNKGDSKPFATETGAAPCLYLEMDGDGPVVVNVKNTEAKEARNFVVLICLESDGVAGSLDTLKECATGLNKAIAGSKLADKLQMDQNYDDVCIAAALLTSDKPDATFNRSFRKDETYVMIGVGDDNCADVGCNTYVREDDGKDGKQLSTDKGQEEGPIVVNAFKAGEEDFKGNVHVTMNKLKDDSKPSFAVTAILVKKD